MIIYDHHFSHGPFGVCPQFRNEIEDCRFLLVIHKLYILSNSSMKHLPRVSHITNTFHICINHDIKKSMNHQYQSISIIINHHESSIIIIYHIFPIVFLFFLGNFGTPRHFVCFSPGDGRITVAEFLEGAIRLRGLAKSVDLPQAPGAPRGRP